MPLVLGDLGEDLRQLRHLVDRRRRVVGAGGGGQGFVAGVATFGSISDEILNAFDGQLLLQVRRVAGSGAAFFAGGCLGRGGGLRFERSFRGRGLELVFEIAEFGFEFQQTRFEHGYHEPTSRAIEHGFEFEWGGSSIPIECTILRNSARSIQNL